MKNFVPFEKLSKKERKKLNAAKRGSRGEINPISRKSENKKAYSRKNPKVDPWDFQLVEKVKFKVFVHLFQKVVGT